MRLRHYGASAFDRSLFMPIVDSFWCKPRGGLWTSPVDSAYGWRDWCAENEYGDCATHFDITFKGNVLTIDSVADLNNLVWAGPSRYMQAPHFEALVCMGVDAIHLTVRGQELTRLSMPRNLYGWDCESVLVMNADCLYD